MENLTITGTSKTPTIEFDYQSGNLHLKGRSIPENSLEFFQPILNWIEDYTQRPQLATTVEVKLEYFNTSSSKHLLDMFKKLERLSSNGRQVVINWHYDQEDEDMYEVGQDYQVIVKIPFKLIPSASTV